jgi:hypothetical protein
MNEIMYEGKCIVFCGLSQVDNSYVYTEKYMEWILESEDETKTKLTKGLENIGIKCHEITFEWVDLFTGQRSCHVLCTYDKYVQPHSFEADFYIEELTTFDFGGAVEFSLVNML